MRCKVINEHYVAAAKLVPVARVEVDAFNLRAGIGLLALTWAAGGLDPWFVGTGSAQEASPAQPVWTVPEIGALPSNTYGRLVRRGRDLITATYAYIGPEVPDRAKRFAGNNLSCGNCHLQAGTKKFGIPLFGLLGEYPHYSARSGAPITIEDRLNACMTRTVSYTHLTLPTICSV